MTYELSRYLARVFDETLCQRAQRPVPERNDPGLPLCSWKLNRQHLKWQMSGPELHNMSRDDCKKASVRCQSCPHVDGLSIDRRARWLEPARAKSLDYTSVESGACLRPSPPLLQKLCKIDLTPASQWIIQASDHDQPVFQEHFTVHILVDIRVRLGEQSEFNAPRSQIVV